MKHFRQILAAALVAALCAGLLAVPAAAAAEAAVAQTSDAYFGGDNSPVVLIHGNTQSDVYLYADDDVTPILEGGNPVSNWPPTVDITALLLKLIGPLLLSVLLQHDVCLTKTLKTTVRDIFPLLKSDENGLPAHNMRVVTYMDSLGKPLSLAESEEARLAARRFRIEERDMRATEDTIYYFAYDSFGNNAVNTAALADYIQAVSEKHGGSKVSLVPISLGGTLIVSLLHDYYDDIVPLLLNVVFVVPAADGTTIVGDLYTKRLSTDNQNLYRDMIPALVPGWLGYLLNMALRLLPKRVLHGVLDAALDSLIGDYLRHNTTMWSLVPADYYEDAREMWLQGDENQAVRDHTDNFHQAQLNSRANIQRMRDVDGVRVYDICNYDVPLYSIAGSYTRVNADSVIHLSGASLGATSGYVGTPLPASYVSEDPQCTDPEHNHMSPDGIVDASTGAIPCQTWFFKGGWHDHTPRNDLAMALVIRLATSSEYETVYSMEDVWPQFNHCRLSRDLRIDLLPMAEGVNPAGLCERDAIELAAAIAGARIVLAKTIAVPGEYEQARDRVAAILVKLGLIEAEKRDYLGMVLDPVFGFLNNALYCGYGAGGFLDPFWVRRK